MHDVYLYVYGLSPFKTLDEYRFVSLVIAIKQKSGYRCHASTMFLLHYLP
jgi:hypothetical protein